MLSPTLYLFPRLRLRLRLPQQTSASPTLRVAFSRFSEDLFASNMAASAEVTSHAADPAPEAAVAVKGEASKAKKAKVLKPKKPSLATKSATVVHPPYLQMIKEAISSLKERTGSSQYAIAKFLDEKYKSGLPVNYKKILTIQLRNLSKQGKLTKVKGSFKLSEALKKPAAAPKASKPSASAAKVAQKAVVRAKTVKVKSSKVAKPLKSSEAVKPKAVKLVAASKAAKAKIAPPKVAVAKPASKKAPVKAKAAPAPKALKVTKSTKPTKSPAKLKPKRAVRAAKKAKAVGK